MRRTLFTLIILALSPLAAWAQTDTPQQIQALIAHGDTSTALDQLHTILQAHPNSGPAWYLEAEAQDAAGNEAAARAAFQHAEQVAPNLPFADPQKAEALKEHLGLAGHHSGGFSTVFIVIAVLVVLFLALRLFARRRTYGAGPVYRDGFNAPPPMGGQPYGYGPQGGAGVGSTILSGLAAGAGFAVGERAVEDMFGGNRNVDQGQNFDPNNVPSRDDGLSGDPGWGGGNDDDQNNGGFDPGNDW
jgi:hypothetical protein